MGQDVKKCSVFDVNVMINRDKTRVFGLSGLLSWLHTGAYVFQCVLTRVKLVFKLFKNIMHLQRDCHLHAPYSRVVL